MTVERPSDVVKVAEPQFQSALPSVVSRAVRTRGIVALLFVLTIGSCIVSLGFGSYPVSFRDTVAVLIGHLTGQPADVPGPVETIIWQLRMPRVLTGAWVGAGLAASGAAIQAVVRNILADPYLLGVSSGASLGAALVITLGLGSLVGVVSLAAGAFAGALVALVLVVGLIRANGNFGSTRLVLAGITVSYFLAAATNLVVVFADSRDAIRAITFWMLGSLSQSAWATVPMVAVCVLATITFLVLWARRLDAISLGDDVARSLGIDPLSLRCQVAVVSSLGVAASVAVSGSVGFVGLVVPHLARRLVGATHRLVIVTSALLGASLLVWADALARTVLAPREIPLGILTALIGTPLLMVLVRRSMAVTNS
jgi:iron complex transport system permease protein